MPSNEGLAPPEWLASLAGPGSFSEIGVGWLRCLIDLCELSPDDQVLDVGCGPGRVALALTDYLSTGGGYEGLDVLPWAIDWCRQEITPSHPNFSFRHADVFSAQYRPEGMPAKDYSFPYEANRFDVACATSLFTHLLPDELERYLSEIARVLRPGGRALMTFYLLNDEALRSTESGTLPPEYRFGHDHGDYRLTFENAPGYIVGYREEFLRKACAEAGLRLVDPIHHGQWCGRDSGLSWQDVVIAECPS
jgi:SAM-dependent methyltransferase